MTEPVTQLFGRAEREGDLLPVPTVDAIVARGQQLRRRRRALSAGAAALALVGAVLLVRPGDVVTPTLPMATTSVPGPGDGFLEASDLGSGGWVRAQRRDGASGAEQPACAGSSIAAEVVDGTGGQQIYRGSTPEGGEWLLEEHVLTVSAEDARTLSALFRSTADPACTRPAGGSDTEIVLAADASTLITGTLLPQGAVGFARVYALSGTTWVFIDTLPGGAIGQIPLPGQTRWLLDVAAKAVERATGTRPAVPTPNAAAQQAAAKYVPPTEVLHVQSPAPRPVVTGGTATGPATSDGASSSSGRPPKGFLSLLDLGTTGDWTVAPDAAVGDYRSGAELPVALPTCGTVGAVVPAGGNGASLVYRGSTSGGSGEWILTETVVTLHGRALARAKAALAAAATCPDVGGGFDDTLGKPRRAANATSSSLVLGYLLGDGRTGFAQAWALKGSTLVQLDTLPGGAAGGAVLPGGTDWLQGVLVKAVHRATT